MTTLSSAIPETPADELDDLNALLGEAVQIAAARKAVRRGATTGAKVDPAMADLAAMAEAALRWTPQAAVARFVEEHCACGASHKRFDGWFILSQHRTDPSARRFARSDSHEDLPSWHYVALQEVTYCAECVESEALPLATPDFLTGIDALGMPPLDAGAQLSIPGIDYAEVASVESVVLVDPEDLLEEQE